MAYRGGDAAARGTVAFSLPNQDHPGASLSREAHDARLGQTTTVALSVREVQ